jgi:hypothetical protein
MPFWSRQSSAAVRRRRLAPMFRGPGPLGMVRGSADPRIVLGEIMRNPRTDRTTKRGTRAFRRRVPGAGLEPARPEGRGILSPLRLPIPPPGPNVQCIVAERGPQRASLYGRDSPSVALSGPTPFCRRNCSTRRRTCSWRAVYRARCRGVMNLPSSFCSCSTRSAR